MNLVDYQLVTRFRSFFQLSDVKASKKDVHLLYQRNTN